MNPNLSPVSAEVIEVFANGRQYTRQRPLADETPVAIEVNGFGYAVLMATGRDLEDLCYGFLSADRLIDQPTDIVDLICLPSSGGFLLRTTIAGHLVERISERMRPRLSDSSCGLCSLENIEQVLRPLPAPSAPSRAENAAVFRACTQLRDRQPLNAATGAVHAASLATADGDIRLVREDVGRHNAFDKLIGAMAREGLGWDGGFAVLTSRCSYELVEKAALADCPMLVTVSAPTSLAVRRACDAGLKLVVLARDDSFLEVVSPGQKC